MSEHLNALLDPRGYQERPMLELAKRPTLEELKQELFRRGALGASMSGTGPTVFGLFDAEAPAREAAEGLKDMCRDVFVTETL